MPKRTHASAFAGYKSSSQPTGYSGRSSYRRGGSSPFGLPAPPPLRGRVARGFTRRSGFYGRYFPNGNELKFFDTTLSYNVDFTAEVPATGQICLIPQGVTESTRVGRKCTIKSILLKGALAFVPAAAANATSTGYMWLILDKQTNGAAAVASDVFSNVTTQSALRNLANSSRFKILKKFKFTFNSGAGVTTAYNNVSMPFECYKRLSIPLEFSSTTGAITELKSNNIFLMAGADFTDDLIQMAGVCRVRFIDG